MVADFSPDKAMLQDFTSIKLQVRRSVERRCAIFRTGIQLPNVVPVGWQGHTEACAEYVSCRPSKEALTLRIREVGLEVEFGTGASAFMC